MVIGEAAGVGIDEPAGIVSLARTPRTASSMVMLLMMVLQLDGDGEFLFFYFYLYFFYYGTVFCRQAVGRANRRGQLAVSRDATLQPTVVSRTVVPARPSRCVRPIPGPPNLPPPYPLSLVCLRNSTIMRIVLCKT